MFHYRAKVLRVIDGDTIEVLADLGFGVHSKITLRLYGVDAPERNNPDEAGRAELAKRFLETEIGLVKNQIEIRTYPDVRQSDKSDGFKRYLAIAYAGSVDLNLALLQNGLASAYSFRKAK